MGSVLVSIVVIDDYVPLWECDRKLDNGSKIDLLYRIEVCQVHPRNLTIKHENQRWTL
jgi:hypothetical protein